MSVYNGAGYVAQAIDSVLAQTYRDFEFIIINDGSTDDTAGIIDHYQDDRIRVVNQENQGLVASLNTAIGLAQAPLIARMDADDVAMPERLEHQVAFMSEHNDYVITGSNLVFIDGQGQAVLDSPLLLDDGEIRLEMLIRSPFGHGAVMYRREAVQQAGGYAQAYWPAEDYDLWRRLLSLGKFSNLNEVLYHYRVNDDGISSQNTQRQKTQAGRVRDELWAKLELAPGVSFGKACVHYPTESSYTRLQLGRLTSVYVDVIREALRRHRYRYGLQVLAGLLGSARGAYFFSRYLVHKLLRG